MKILVSGTSGLVGSALCNFLKINGHEIFKLVRTRANLLPNEIAWNLDRGVINPELLEGLDAVIHLAGENIASGRWSDAKKKRIRDSRVKGTLLLSQALASLKRSPHVLIAASAVGYYGNCGEEMLMEKNSKGTGFLADVCAEWETSTRPAIERGIRVVNLRFGAILSLQGGILKKIITPFKFGVGGQIGAGNQYMSWIALDDLLNVINETMQNKYFEGPVNAVSPNPVTNYEFTKAMGAVLHRPTFMTVPAKMARFVFGEMADELMLSSQRVLPEVLLKSGFKFSYPNIKEALEFLLNKNI
ncbi:MAG: TIGR01777 family protein [Parachlamydiaceae bacterium]|nr:TIGR01777 family protein [Parachlamydiaceae bacterium]